MSELVINDTEISSAIYSGNATKEFAKGFTEGFGDKWYNPFTLFDKVNGFVKSTANFFEQIGKKISSGIDFFKQWLSDDPVGATAGAATVLLGGAVILFVGGAAVGAISTAASNGTIGSSILGIVKGMKTILGIKGIAALGLTTVGLGTLIRVAVRGTQFLYSFNWQQSDKQIEEAQKNSIKGLAGIFGQALGSTLGTLVCGTALMESVKGLKTVRVNPVVLAKLKEISEFDPTTGEVGELYEEALENIKALINSVSRVAINITFMEIYKNVRKLIKATAKGVNLSSVFPWLGKLIENWGKEGNESWSFAIAQENFIESIKDDTLRNFTEEVLESFFESCAESSMIVSYAL